MKTKLKLSDVKKALKIFHEDLGPSIKKTKKYTLVMTERTYDQFRLKRVRRMSLKSILKHMNFAVDSAYDNLGAYVGGDGEEEYRHNLYILERAFQSLKKYGARKK